MCIIYIYIYIYNVFILFPIDLQWKHVGLEIAASKHGKAKEVSSKQFKHYK